MDNEHEKKMRKPFLMYEEQYEDQLLTKQPDISRNETPEEKREAMSKCFFEDMLAMAGLDKNTRDMFRMEKLLLNPSQQKKKKTIGNDFGILNSNIDKLCGAINTLTEAVRQLSRDVITVNLYSSQMKRQAD